MKIHILSILILAALLSSAAYSGDALAPLGMSNADLGGGALNAYTPGVYDGAGLNNIGLLVRCWGLVTYVDMFSPFFYIDDGSGLNDQSGISNAKGIRVAYDGLAEGNVFYPPYVGQYVAVTGISSVTAIFTYHGEISVRTLRPRNQNDLNVVVH